MPGGDEHIGEMTVVADMAVTQGRHIQQDSTSRDRREIGDEDQWTNEEHIRHRHMPSTETMLT